MFSRILRIARTAAGKARHAAGTSDADDEGLHAFASEGQRPSRTSRSPHSPARLLPALLAGLVVLQAWPTFVWIQDVFTFSAEAGTPAVVEAAQAPAFSSPPTAPLAAAPCPPVTEPQPSVQPRPARTPVAAAPESIRAGLLAVSAPVPMHVHLKGKLVGTTEAETILLPVGTHDLDFVSEAVGYRATQQVAIQAGKTSRLRLEPPDGILHVNASPWAEVWIDDERVGETPIGNFRAPVGRHQVLFRHPELGERRTTVLVTLKEPARVSMDLRQR